MAAPKGHPRYGGRTKGTPNKNTSDLMSICEKHGIHPFEGMVILAKEEKDPDKKFDKLERIAQYVHPKRKAVEVSGGDGEAIDVGLSANDIAKIHADVRAKVSRDRK